MNKKTLYEGLVIGFGSFFFIRRFIGIVNIDLN